MHYPYRSNHFLDLVVSFDSYIEDRFPIEFSFVILEVIGPLCGR